MPDEVDLSRPVHLMGTCAAGLSKKVEAAGGKAIVTHGCPPTEPNLSWAIIDGKERSFPDLTEVHSRWQKLKISLLLFVGRRRLEYETVRFMKWLESQKRT